MEVPVKLTEVQSARVDILPPLEPVSSGPAGSQPCAVAEAGLIHDLGNLIQIATSAVSVMARVPDLSSGRSRAMLDRARSCLEQAGALVRQNLIRANEGRFAEDRAGVAECLADVRSLVAAMDRPGLVLAVDIEPGLPDARCDPIGLRRAILNLVFNAGDAMKAAGSVLVRGQAIRSGHGPAWLDLQVIDHGKGMAPDTVARVFDPFFTTKTGGLGGVGLPMVQHFVRAAGGDVSIASELGVGTVVTLRLPAAPHIEHRSEEQKP
jgi:signal transduction histidine kinase